MRAVVQRVSRASVTVGEEVTGAIGEGLMVLVGVTHDDSEADAAKLAEKLWKLRIFSDAEGKMNRSVADGSGEILLVSQFTLYGDARKGNRPSYMAAARPEHAEPLIAVMAERLAELGARVEQGRFGADMDVELLNQGPVTVLVGDF